MTVDQYNALLEAIPSINASLKASGVEVGSTAVGGDDDDEAAGPPAKQKKKTKPQSEKSNIDATSDEDE